MKSILLTGSSGFLGLNLLNKLVESNYLIYALYSKNKPKFKSKKIKLIKINLLLSEEIEKKLKKKKI